MPFWQNFTSIEYGWNYSKICVGQLSSWHCCFSLLTLALLQGLQWVLIIQFVRWQLYNPLFLSKSGKRGLQYQAYIQWYDAIMKVLCFISLEALSLKFLATLHPWYIVNCFFILTHEHEKLNRIKWDYFNATSWIHNFGWPTKSSHSFLLAILEINCAYLTGLNQSGVGIRNWTDPLLAIKLGIKVDNHRYQKSNTHLLYIITVLNLFQKIKHLPKTTRSFVGSFTKLGGS